MGATMQLWRLILMQTCIGLVNMGPVDGQGPVQLNRAGSRFSADAVVLTELPSRVTTHLGNYPIGREVRTRICLKNSTGSPLNLRLIDPDCGCLSVVPEQRALATDGSLRLSLKLAPSNKVAIVRRSIRIFFQESESPLVLDVDVRLRGPLGLSQTTMNLSEPDSPFTVFGRIHELGGQIQRVESVRGTFLTSRSLEQTSKSFKFSAIPTFSFGAVEDLVRVHYRDASAQRKVVDLPILLRFNTAVRFLPSTLNLDQKENRWVGTVRMIVVPGKLKLPVDQLRFASDDTPAFGEPSSNVTVHVHHVSSVMSKMEVVITQGKHASGHDNKMLPAPFPTQLLVRGFDNQVVGILKLVRNGEE